MMFVMSVNAKMTVFVHENLKIDLTISSKTKLYKDDLLLFIGDGYKAITIMINNAQDKDPVKEKFNKQLNMREKPRFAQKGDDLEALRKEAHESFGKLKEEKPKRKTKSTQWNSLTKS